MILQKKITNEVVHKLELCDDTNDDILIIAVKSNMPDYKMAYQLNKYLKTKFSKVSPELTIEDNGTAYFRSFEFDDEYQHLTWRLFENKSNHKESVAVETLALFDTEDHGISTTSYLIPEWKSIDYFILINNIDYLFNIDELIEKIQNIPNISTQFVVDIDSLSTKSQKNLIF